ncbi:GntR family transcriptional regulator [Aliiroseovarius crassostreae]|uniref:GntR family transcriptional regulator n=2 Tax=Aliiroseovarius crassostreae TaxID=154981 RepID=A0A0P7IWJ5_9RHOB|nr:GntR family transcriptional regulator [Aliiroseovarius crassostreae]
MLSAAISEGKLAPGTKLPTHRAFAEQCNVALATATRVYKELERRAEVVGEAGRGTFVRDLGLPPTLGVHQADTEGLIDLVFNMPGGAGDAEILRGGLRRLSSAGDLEAMLRYQPHGGRTHERRIIAESLKPTLGTVLPENLLITSGGQHGLATIAFGVLQRGEAIAADTLTYPGFKSVAALQGVDVVPVEGTDGIMDPDALDRQCRVRKLRAVYLMPTVHNPLGSVIDATTRQRIVEVARAHDLLVIEDGAYAFLESDPPPSFIELAPERTIHVGGFSKSLATGLRLGYLVTPSRHIPSLLEAIRATTWNAPAVISGLVTSWIEDGTLAKSEDDRKRDGAERQAICRTSLPNLSLSAHPNAGFSWVWLGNGERAEPIVAALKKRGISASGAEPFATTTAVPQALRLAFGGIPKADLQRVLETVRLTVEEIAQ